MWLCRFELSGVQLPQSCWQTDTAILFASWRYWGLWAILIRISADLEKVISNVTVDYSNVFARYFLRMLNVSEFQIKNLLVGDEASKLRSMLEVSYPMENGMVRSRMFKASVLYPIGYPIWAHLSPSFRFCLLRFATGTIWSMYGTTRLALRRWT